MNLNEKIGADLTAAMKAKDAPRLSALRMLKAAIMNKSVEKNRDLDDGEHPVQQGEDAHGGEHLALADAGRHRVGGLHQAVDAPGLAAHLGEDPAE